MSRLDRKSIAAEVVPGFDPIERLFAARVPMRAIIAYPIQCLDWLVENSKTPIKLLSQSRDGEFEVVTVDAIALIEHAHNSGWVVDGEELTRLCPPYYNQCLTDGGDVVQWLDEERGGALWYSGENCYCPDTFVPLCLPDRVARVAQAKKEAFDAARAQEVQRERDADIKYCAEELRKQFPSEYGDLETAMLRVREITACIASGDIYLRFAFLVYLRAKRKGLDREFADVHKCCKGNAESMARDVKRLSDGKFDFTGEGK